jgi:hypothetical protein
MIDRICLVAAWGSCMSLGLVSYSHLAFEGSLLHLSVDDPVEVFFALIWPTWSALDGTEKSRTPFDSFIGAFRGLVSLAVFDLGLFVRCSFMVPGQKRLNRLVP